MFRKDRDGRGGGVAILVRNYIPARKVNLKSKMEAVGVEVELSGNVQRCIAVYLPPKVILKEGEFFKLIEGQKTTWGCRSQNPNGKILEDVIKKTPSLRIHARGEILNLFISFRSTRPWEASTKFSLSSGDS